MSMRNSNCQSPILRYGLWGSEGVEEEVEIEENDGEGKEE